jgi:hypothetical protein
MYRVHPPGKGYVAPGISVGGPGPSPAPPELFSGEGGKRCRDGCRAFGVNEADLTSGLEMYSRNQVSSWPAHFLTASIALGVSLIGTSLEAQTVQGRLLDAPSGQPVAAATVMLLDTARVPVSSTSSNASGAFSVQASEPGDYLLLVQALGYASVLDGIYELGEGGEISLEIRLRPSPLEMDSLEVSVQQAFFDARLRGSGFAQRKKTGFGYFVTPEEIEERDPQFLWDLFKGIPGIFNASTSGIGTEPVLFRSGLGPIYCRPGVYVDGSRVYNAGGGLEAVVRARDVLALEVYTRASSAPLQFGGTTAGGCGVVLIWTK